MDAKRESSYMVNNQIPIKMEGHQFKSWIFELRETLREIKNSCYFLYSWTQFNPYHHCHRHCQALIPPSVEILRDPYKILITTKNTLR